MRVILFLFCSLFFPFSLIYAGQESLMPVIVEADTFELDSKTDLIVASGNVMVVRGPLRLAAKRVQYDRDKLFLEVSGDVVLTNEDMKMNCQYVLMDRFKQELVASGEVLFSFNQIEGRVSRVVYDLQSNLVTLLDSPKVFRGKNRLSGQKIYINLVTGKVTTMGNAKIVFDENGVDL